MLLYYRSIFTLICIAFFGSLATASFAKGLDKLTPNVANPEKANSNNSQKKEGKNDSLKKAQKIEPSAASKSLSDRLYIATSINYVSVSVDKGDWSSRGATDLGIGYMFHRGENLKLFGTFRYVPIDTVVEYEKQSYRGIIETYHIGVLAGYEFKKSISFLGSLEIGHNSININSIDFLPEDDDLESGTFSTTIGAGAEFKLGDKFTLGPRVYIGFGDVQTVQAGATGSFIF